MLVLSAPVCCCKRSYSTHVQLVKSNSIACRDRGDRLKRQWYIAVTTQGGTSSSTELGADAPLHALVHSGQSSCIGSLGRLELLQQGVPRLAADGLRQVMDEREQDGACRVTPVVRVQRTESQTVEERKLFVASGHNAAVGRRAQVARRTLLAVQQR